MNWFRGFLKNQKASTIQLLLIVGIVVVANLLAEELVVRFDLTENNRYTLSEASVEIAKSLEDPVTITAYFSEDLPPNLQQVKQELTSFMEEFRAYSGNNLEYQFVNPNKDQMAERKAQQAGVRPVSISVRKRDQMSQKRAYLGAVFTYQGKKEVVPFVRPGGSMEYTLASKIKQLTIDEKPKIGLLQGHGEPSQLAMQQLIQELKQRYQLVNVSGLDTTSVPADIESLLIIRPQKKLTQNELKAIDQYIMAGGKAIFAVNRVQTMMQRGMAMPRRLGIDQLLSAYHIPLKSNLLRDANAAPIRVQQNRGGFQMINTIRYPYIPNVTNFSDHPISSGLESVIFQFVSTLDTTAIDSAQSLTVLAKSSSQSGTVSGRFNLSPDQNWTQQDFTQSFLPVGAVVEGTFTSAFSDIDSVEVPLEKSRKTSIVIFGDGDFVVNGQGQRSQQLPADNISLMVNSVDWLSDDTGLIKLRTQQVTDRSLMQVSESTKTMLKYVNIFLPILFVIGYGLVRYRHRKARRQKWIEQGI